MGQTHITERIREDDTGTTPTGQRPDAPIGIEDAKFETCSGSFIEFFDCYFSCGFGHTKRIGKFDIFPVFFLFVVLTGVDSRDKI
jgi:hypothetical protein